MASPAHHGLDVLHAAARRERGEPHDQEARSRRAGSDPGHRQQQTGKAVQAGEQRDPQVAGRPQQVPKSGADHADQRADDQPGRAQPSQSPNSRSLRQIQPTAAVAAPKASRRM